MIYTRNRSNNKLYKRNHFTHRFSVIQLQNASNYQMIYYTISKKMPVFFLHMYIFVTTIQNSILSTHRTDIVKLMKDLWNNTWRYRKMNLLRAIL